LRRPWVEALEERQLLSSSGTFGGLTFNSPGTTDFNDLFAHTNSVNSVAYSGSISTSNQSVSGTFSINYVNSSSFSVTASGLTQSQGGGVVSVNNGSASLTLTSSGLTGTFSSVNVGVSSSIPYTTTDPSNGTTTTNNDPVSLSSGTGYSFNWNTVSGNDNNLQVGVNGATLTVLPGQAMIGNFVFEQQDSSTAQATVSSINISLSNGLVSLANSAGVLHIKSGSITGNNNGVSSGSISASSSGTTFAATASSVLGFAIDTTASDQNLQITGTNLAVTANGFQFTADAQFEQDSPSLVGTALRVDSLSFGDGTNTLVTVGPNGSAPNNSYGPFTFQTNQFAGIADISATVTGDNSLVSASGNGVLEINTASTPLTFPDPANPTTKISIPAEPIVDVHLSPITLNVPGSVALTNGTFDFTQGASSVSVSAGGISATFGSASMSNAGGVLTFSGGSLSGSISGSATLSTTAASIPAVGGGSFTVTFSSTASSVSATNVVVDVAGAALTGNYSIVYVNSPTPSTTFTATDGQIDYGNGLISVTGLSGQVTVAGNSIASGSTVTGTVSSQIGLASFGGTVSADFTSSSLLLVGANDTVTVGDQSITGNFTFSLSSGNVSIAATSVSASLGNGVVSISGASGNVIISGTTAFTGTLNTGTLAAGSNLAGSGVSFGSSSLSITVGPQGITASGTGDTVTIGSSPTITGNFSFSEDSAGLELSISSVSINANALIVSGASGSVLVSSTGLSGSISGAFTSTVTNLSGNLGVIFTTGPPASLQITASNTHFVVGTGASAAQVNGDFAVTVSGSNVSLSTTDLTASLGNGLVTVGPQPGATTGATGSLTITGGTSLSGSFSGFIAVGSATGVSFSGPVTLSVSNSAITASGTNDTITIAGQSVTASFTVAFGGGQLQLQNVSVSSFSLGGVVTLSSLTGNLNISGTGISGSLTASGGFTSSIANLAGTFTLAFSPGSLSISGTGASLTVEGQTVSGSFSFTQDTNGVHLSATNFGASFAGGLVTINNGTGSLNISSAGAVSGSFSGTLAVSSLSSGVAGHAVFEGPISVSASGALISASGTGDTLNLAGQTFTNVGFNFSLSGSTLNLSVAGLSLAIPGIVAVNNASGTLTISSAGVSGTASGALSSTLAGLSGGLAVSFAPGMVQISGTGDTLAVGDQSISGNFNFVTSGGSTQLTASDFNASLGGGLVSISNGSGSLSVTGSQVSGTFTGTIAAGSAQAVAFSGPITVSVTTGSSGAITASGVGDTLTVAGQQITGNFSFSENPTSHQLSVTVSNVTGFSLGGAFTVSSLSGSLTIGSSGVSGSLSASVTANITGLSAGGTFSVVFSPGNLQVTVTGATITVGGQSIAGSFDFVQDSTGLHVTATDFSASLGGGLVMVTAGSGTLNVASGQVTGTFTGTVSAGSAETGASFAGPITVSVTPTSISAGTPAGQVDTLTIAGQQVTGALSFSWNGTTLSASISGLNFSLGTAISITGASGSLQVSPSGVSGSASSGMVSANFSGFTFTGGLSVAFAPGTISVSGTNDSLTAGDESISGSFSFTQDSTGIHLSSTGLNASLANGLVAVTGGSASLSLANGQITGSFSGNVSAGSGLTGASFSGPVNVALAPGAFSISTPAGQSDTLTVAGQPFSAGFSFTEDSNGLELTLSNLNFSLPAGSSSPLLSLTNAGGMLHVASSGVSGSVSGTVAANFPGVTLAGSLSVSFAPNSFQISGTGDTLTVFDQTISGNFSFTSSGSGLQLSATNLTASLAGGLVTIGPPAGNPPNGATATFAISSAGAITGSFTGTVAVGTAQAVSFSGPITVSIGGGSITAATPTSPPGQTDTLTVLGQSVSAAFSFAENSTNHQLMLTVSGVSFSLAGGAVTVTNAGGSLLVSSSGISGSISGGISSTISGVSFGTQRASGSQPAGQFSIAFTPGSLQISGTNVFLTFSGQQINGNFTFSQTGGTTTLSISNLNMSIGGIVNVTAGSGSFTFPSGGGISGTASGTIAIASGSSNIQFTGSFQVSVSPSGVSVSGTGDTLAFFGQTISGNFSFTQSGTSADLHIDSLNMSLGGGLVMVTGGAADFTVAGGNITGTATGALSIGSATGLSLSGTVTVTLSATGVSVAGTGISVTVGSLPALTGDLTFTRDSTTGAIDVSVANMSVQGASGPVTVSGSLTVAPTGLSGTLTGGIGPASVTVTFGNGTFTISAAVSTSFHDTIGPVSISGTINGNVSSNGTGSISLTNVDLSLANGLVTVTGGTASLMETGGHITSGSFGGTVSLGGGVSGVSVGGRV